MDLGPEVERDLERMAHEIREKINDLESMYEDGTVGLFYKPPPKVCGVSQGDEPEWRVVAWVECAEGDPDLFSTDLEHLLVVAVEDKIGADMSAAVQLRDILAAAVARIEGIIGASDSGTE